jgi:hypothetical protein
VPVLPCASRESITVLDIIKKKSVVNCVVPSLYSCDRSECYLEVKHIAIDLDDIYARIIPLNTIRSLCHEFADIFNELLIVNTTTGDVIQTLIIVDPECNIPGLIILPTVVGSIQSVGLISDCHCVCCEC